MINGISWLVVTKLDVLDELAEIPVCVGYKIDGKKTVEIPAQASGYEKIECVYQKMPGWRTSTVGHHEVRRVAQGGARISGIRREGDRREDRHGFDRPGPRTDDLDGRICGGDEDSDRPKKF